MFLCFYFITLFLSNVLRNELLATIKILHSILSVSEFFKSQKTTFSLFLAQKKNKKYLDDGDNDHDHNYDILFWTYTI